MAVPEGYVALDLVGFTDKGTYSGAAVYMKNDLVHQDNVIWRCIADNTQAVPPAAGENWEKWIEGSAQMSGCTAVDTEGMIGAENSIVVAQALIDAIADKVMNDLVAKTQIVNNLLATVTGNVLDATQGKVLDDKITQLNGNLTGLNAETKKLVVEGAIRIRFGKSDTSAFIDFYAADNEFVRFNFGYAGFNNFLSIQTYDTTSGLQNVYIVSPDN